jgi:hypothetical protein
VDEMRDRSRLIRRGNYGNERAVASLVETWADKLAALLTADTADTALSDPRAAHGGEVLGVPVDTWEGAAKRLGEELATSGPNDYYSMSPEQWLEWALLTVRRGPVPAHGETPALRDYVRQLTERVEYPEPPEGLLDQLHSRTDAWYYGMTAYRNALRTALAADQGERTTTP